jgi:phenylacetate-CoA ligase
VTPLQACQLYDLLESLLHTDNFNSQRLRAHGLNAKSLLTDLPFTFKADLLADQQAHPPWGSIITQPLPQYTRFSHTSGTTTGQPITWLDTPESWSALLRCWQQVYTAAGLVPGQDRLFFAFSFGPFLGFWTAFEAAAQQYLVLPGGGLSSQARLEMIQRSGVTVLCCTPTYAMRLGGQLQGRRHDVKKIIVAGEPGGSLPAVRQRIEALWGARVLDHYGMTEVGPVSYEKLDQPAVLHVMDAYLAEVIHPQTGKEVADGETGELVLTTLQRTASPLLRYRTGDIVQKRMVKDQLTLQGGIIGRTDDMLLVRGVNIYPSAVENLLRSVPEVEEFQICHTQVQAMTELHLRVELVAGAPTTLTKELEAQLKDTFALRIPVQQVAVGTLPRFEFKAKRLIRE